MSNKRTRPESQGERSGRFYGPFPDFGTRLKIVADKNPKKPGTQTWHRFEKYLKARPRSVGEFLKYGTREDIRWDVAHGFIALEPDPRFYDD